MLRMRTETSVIETLCGLIVLATCSRAARVVSGQTVCHGGPEHPCYKIAYFRDVSSRVAFWEAQRACNMDGGSLLSIESPDEQQHIEWLLQNLSKSAVDSGSGYNIADGDFWIGLTRVEEESQGEHGSISDCPNLYRWTDSSVSDFRNWYHDEPSCGGEACVVMYHQPTAQAGIGGLYLYKWNDDRCTMKHNFICKYEPESHLVKEHGDRPASSDTDFLTEYDENKPPAVNDEEHLHVTVAGSSSMLLIYVVIPTIPLLLLILVASGTCCFQMLSRRRPQTKTSGAQSTLWISKMPKQDNTMEV